MLRMILMTCLLCFSGMLLAAERIEPEVSGWGGVRALRLEGQRFEVKTGMDVAGPGWKSVAGLSAWSVKDVKASRADGVRSYSGRIPFGETSVNYKQVVTVEKDGVRVRMEATPLAVAPAEGMRMTVAVPVKDFIRGEAQLLDAAGSGKSVALPASTPADPHFLAGEASGVRFSKGARSLTVRFDKPRPVTVQDNRAFKADEYCLYFMFHSGELVAGQTATAELLISAEMPADDAAVALTVEPQELYELHGFGGNFVYGAESPSSIYNLDHLNLAWGRVWMPLHEWEAENDNADPAMTNMELLAANDKPGSKLRASLEIARELEKRKIPYIASVWGVPSWMASNPGKPGENKSGIIVTRENWNELAESIGSYLLYAREKYGCEPEMFSFNEPDWGVTVKLTAEEHREMTILLGRHFEKLGLKTRQLGGDVTNPRNTAKYVAPLIADAEAMKYVDALAFHSWGGGTSAQYREWHEAAVKANKPLLVTEAGVDAQAWQQSAVFGEYWYAHGEAKQYMEMLQHARPQAIMLWEYTDDYGLLKLDRSKTPPTIATTKRFHFMRQFAALTPRNGKVLLTRSSRGDVLFTAVKGKDGKVTMHIVNDGPARKVNIAGPKMTWRAYVTDATRDMQEVSSDEISAWSMMTIVGD